ncbi:hypothetical protein AVEN_144414-1 [Araneus ventricosus]|uniref:Uncharacterized protein n=1 Tax=Araneus ventricosus TaxID=182803 RepID=A0A4Y2NWM3_ARAVE|nr:hypothetical protein AVEN_144414-1 [Araneus ventricosus]
MKQVSMAWRHTSSPIRTKSKVPPSAGKVMATVFFLNAKELSKPSLCRKAQPLMLSHTAKGFARSCEKQETWKVKQRHCPLEQQCKTSQGTNTRFALQFWMGDLAESTVES